MKGLHLKIVLDLFMLSSGAELSGPPSSNQYRHDDGDDGDDDDGDIDDKIIDQPRAKRVLKAVPRQKKQHSYMLKAGVILTAALLHARSRCKTHSSTLTCSKQV